MSENVPSTLPPPPLSSNNNDEEIGAPSGAVSPPTATAELVIAPDDQHPVEVTAVPDHPLEPAEATAILANDNDTNHDAIVIAATMNAEPPLATAAFDLEAAAETTAEVRITMPPAQQQSQQIRTIRTRAEFNSVTFFKNEHSQLGLTVRKNPPFDGGLFQVTALDPTGILAQSPLCVGDILLSINGKSCADLESSQQVMDWLHLLSGTVTLVGHNCGGDPKLVETMIEKPTPDARVGLTLRRSRSSLVVSRIPADGLFVHSLLNVGDRVLSINSVECTHMDGQVALDMIRACPQYVTVVTETLATTGVVVAVSSSSSSTAAAAAADALQLLTTHRHSYEYREQTCFCIWMLILSLLLVGIGVYRSNQ